MKLPKQAAPVMRKRSSSEFKASRETKPAQKSVYPSGTNFYYDWDTGTYWLKCIMSSELIWQEKLVAMDAASYPTILSKENNMKLPKQAQPVARNSESRSSVKTDNKGVHPSVDKGGIVDGIAALIKALL